MSEDFDLLKFARDVYQSSNAVTRQQLAKEVLAQLDRNDEHAALEQALPYVAHHIMHAARAPLSSLGGQNSSDSRMRRAAEGSNPARNVNSARSWKTRQSRAHWRAKLEQRYAWGQNHEAVALGDLDVAALTGMRDFARKMVTANQATVDEADRWLSDLATHRVKTIRELPESVLRARLDSEAAA